MKLGIIISFILLGVTCFLNQAEAGLAQLSEPATDDIVLTLKVDLDSQGLATDCLKVIVEEVIPPEDSGIRKIILQENISESDGAFTYGGSTLLDRGQDHVLVLSYGDCYREKVNIDFRCEWQRLLNGAQIGRSFLVGRDSVSPVRLEMLRICTPDQ